MAANVFGDSIIIPAPVGGVSRYFGFGSDETDAVQFAINAGDPNTTPAAVTAPKGSIILDTVGPFVWQNTDAADTWEKVGGQT